MIHNVSEGVPTTRLLSLARLRSQGRSAFLIDNAVLLAGWLVAGSFGYLYHLLLGRMLGPSDYGVVAASVALASLLSAPTAMVMAIAAKYTATLPGLSHQRRLFMKLSWSAGSIGLVLAFAMWLFAEPVGHFLQMPANTVRLLSPVGLLLLIQPVAKGIVQGQRRFLSFSAMQMVEPALRVLSGVTIAAAGMGTAAVAGIPIGLVGGYIFSLWVLRSLFRACEHVEVSVPGLLSYSLASAATMLGLMALQQTDTLLAMHLLAPANAGLYASVATVGKILFFGTGSVAAVMFPRVAALRAEGKESLSVLRSCLLIVGAGSLVLASPFVVAPELVLRVLYGPSYLAASPALPIYAVAAVALALINVLLNYYLAIDARRHLIPLWGAVAVEVALLSVWQPAMQGMAMTVAVVLATLFIALLILPFARRKHAVQSASSPCGTNDGSRSEPPGLAS